MSDWKNDHANESGKALETDLVKDVIEELLANLDMNYSVPNSDLVVYGIKKVAMYAAQVARAQCLGFDPNLLKFTEDESNRNLMERAKKMVEANIPTTIVVAPRKEN